MVEAKTYMTNVPSAQVDKFKGEFLGQTKCGAGIFVSLTSGIARRKLLQYELFPGEKVAGEFVASRIIVFLPNAGADGGGAALIFALHFCNLFMQQQREAAAAAIPVDPSETERRLHALHAHLDAQMVRANDLLAQAFAFEKHTSLMEKTVRDQRALSQQLKKSADALVRSLTSSSSPSSSLSSSIKIANEDVIVSKPTVAKRVRIDK